MLDPLFCSHAQYICISLAICVNVIEKERKRPPQFGKKGTTYLLFLLFLIKKERYLWFYSAFLGRVFF